MIDVNVFIENGVNTFNGRSRRTSQCVKLTFFVDCVLISRLTALGCVCNKSSLTPRLRLGRFLRKYDFGTIFVLFLLDSMGRKHGGQAMSRPQSSSSVSDNFFLDGIGDTVTKGSSKKPKIVGTPDSHRQTLSKFVYGPRQTSSVEEGMVTGGNRTDSASCASDVFSPDTEPNSQNSQKTSPLNGMEVAK